MSPALLSELFDALDIGEQLVLPNSHSARNWRSEFNARQRMRGLISWESPRITSWSQWANSQWSELVVTGRETRLLLNSAQEHRLWLEVIAADNLNVSVGSADSLAELASSAWKLAAQYRATPRLREFAATNDSKVFAEWGEEFSTQCAGRGCLSKAMLEDALLQHGRTNVTTAPEAMVLVGFSELLPAQRILIEELRQRGVHILERLPIAPAHTDQLRALTVAANEGDELVLAAHWIRKFLNQHNKSGPGARVAVLVPHFTEERGRIEEIVRETLAPELQSIDADLSSTPWEFGSGKALSSLTMIADALTLARWTEGPLALARTSSLLLSPYLGNNGADQFQRDASARFDANQLRGQLLLRPEIAITAVIALAASVSQGATGGPDPLEWLKEVQHYLQRASEKTVLRSFADWMEFVRGLTGAAGWPGKRALTAAEYEMVDAWESTLDLVSTLDFMGQRVNFSTALDALELQTKKTNHSPPLTGAPVQILSVNEAEGSTFDAVVFLHATDANLPSQEQPNPLLSWAMQRSLKMPGSDLVHAAGRDQKYAEDLVKRSGSILFTYAAEDQSGRLRPSPLLGNLSLEAVLAADILPSSSYVQKIAFESVADAESLPPLPLNDVIGGSSVLKLQAACGFLAFAELRLRAQEPRSGDLGLNAGENGSLLHRALQQFWKDVRSQSKLQSMSWVERDAVLTSSIEKAMSHGPHVRNSWDRAYLAVQTARLKSLLQRWLNEELRRGPFTVCDVERNELVTVGPLTLKVRVDRIDKVGDGVLFVDYKTSYAADPKHWLGNRPDDPQLPLYTLLPEVPDLKGVAFAKVRAGHDMKWLGYQAEEGILPMASRSRDKVKDLKLVVDEWRHTLAQLAGDFAEGKADVKPKSFEVNCKRCAQRLLCRFDPASLPLASEDEEARRDD